MLFMTLRIALRALMRNKLRAFLTMLGIIIGVGAVIAMVAIGEGAKETIRSQIASLGTNVLIIMPGTSVQGGVRTGVGVSADPRLADCRRAFYSRWRCRERRQSRGDRRNRGQSVIR